MPIEYYGLPYYGPGEVEISSAGSMLVRLGTVGSPSFVGDGTKQEEFVVEAFNYTLDTQNTQLIFANGEVFLDNGGGQAAAYGYDATDIARVVTFDRRRTAKKHESATLLHVSGHLEIDYDENTGAFSLVAFDEGDRGLVFSVNAEIRNSPRQDSGSRLEVPIGVESDEDVLVLFAGGGTVSSTCSAACSRGSSNITCNDSGCSCVCKHGAPRCICTNSQ